MKAFATKQVQRLDRIAIEKFGIPSIVLMENAGRLTASEIMQMLKNPKDHFVCVVCGAGNNGGDGFVVARHLISCGYRVKVFLIGSAYKLKNDAAVNYKILKKLKCSIQSVRGLNRDMLKDFKKTTLIVDAIFGVGLSRAISNPFKDIIEAINISKKRVIAVDVPSGLDATTGRTCGACIKAYRTITFAVLKKGLLGFDGLTHAGKIKVVDIGIPKQIEKEILGNGSAVR
ncbi:MAG: NAD(P)H-hydrate epimerase [Candidatus Omnitrophica bacterium]|nr:NAD(P)H-hydrate epimerase [Candidatus Omnitrophota bacterium]